MRVLVAMVTKLCTHSFLQWYETHTMLCNSIKCIPVLILKSQRHTFSRTNNFSQINKFFVNSWLADITLIDPKCVTNPKDGDKTSHRLVDQLEMVQRRAARWVTGRYHNISSVSDMLRSLDWQSLEQRRVDSRLSTLYKIRNHLVAIDEEPYLSLVTRKPVIALCEQHRRRSACASALSDQHLCCSLAR